MLTLLLGPSLAVAGPIPKRFLEVELSGTVETPFGSLEKKTLLMMCFLHQVRIGTVGHVRHYRKDLLTPDNEHPERGWPYSELTFEAERVLRGPAVSTYEMDVSGGWLNGRWISVPAQLPQPIVGHRYLTVVEPMNAPPASSGWPRYDQPVIHATIAIDPSVQLPSEASLKADLQALCVHHDFVEPSRTSR